MDIEPYLPWIVVILLVLLMTVITMVVHQRWQQWFGPAGPETTTARSERIAAQLERVRAAKVQVETLRAQATAQAAGPPGARQAQQAAESLGQAEAVVEDEEAALKQLMTPPSTAVFAFVGSIAQYLIFGTLGFIVLTQLMNGANKPPPAGTTPQTLITFLIAAITVGIALILTVSSILSNADDREKRFSQGKEILTALLAVLGTIVGYYFGKDVGPIQGIHFDPVVITRNGTETMLTTTARHGEAPYQFTIKAGGQTADSDSKGVTDQSGLIKGTFKQLAGDKDVSAIISVTDRNGHTANETIVIPGTAEQKAAPNPAPAPAQVPAPAPMPAPANPNAPSPPGAEHPK
jgi:hypothetical protein